MIAVLALVLGAVTLDLLILLGAAQLGVLRVTVARRPKPRNRPEVTSGG